MPETGPDTSTAVAYPSTHLYEEWKDHADNLDLTVSNFIIRMVETGRKQIDLDDASQRTIQELHDRNRDLEKELERQRARNQELERKLHTTVHGEIIDFVEGNPGVGLREIIQHISNTVPGRVASHLDVLEGDALEMRENCYYPKLDSDTTDQETDENVGGEP